LHAIILGFGRGYRCQSVCDCVILQCMTKPTKHELMTELESKITADDYIAPTQWKDMPLPTG